MAFIAVPCFAPQSDFEALPILGAYIVCLFSFPQQTEIDAHKHRYTHMHTFNAERDRGNTPYCVLSPAQPQFLPLLL